MNLYVAVKSNQVQNDGSLLLSLDVGYPSTPFATNTSPAVTINASLAGNEKKMQDAIADAAVAYINSILSQTFVRSDVVFVPWL
jgi:hypothetical protein